VLPAWTIALILLTQPPPGRASAERDDVDDDDDDELPAPDAPRISVAILRADDLDHAALTRAIQLRSPALTIVRVGDEAPPVVDGELRVYIEVRRADAVHVDLTLILADGRAYLRRVDADAEAPARPIAGALANLIAGIEDDSVAPDREDAPVPEALVATPAPPPTKPEPKPTPPQKPQPAPVQPTEDPPRWQLGPTLRLGATLGLARLDPGFHGLGPGGGLDIRSPRGLLLALDLQHLTRPLGATSLGRTRVAIGVGYALRRGSFELPLALLLGVEPWRLRDDHGTVRLESMEGPPEPLLGLGLRLSPGVSARIARSARIRVGLRLDLWASGQPAKGGLRPPELHIPDGPRVGLGSAELHLGLEIGLWFSVGKPRPR
jgi:hypothetical protein